MINNSKKSIDGFSLIELMIVIAMIGLLLLVSYFSKQSMFDNNHQAQVKAFLLEISNRQASYWQQHGSYSETISKLGANIPKSLEKHYKIQLEQAFSPTGYVVKAIPRVENGEGKTFWINHLGATNENWAY